MNKEDIIGTWKLVSFKMIWNSNNKITYPYTDKLTGYLIYTSNDYVSVHIMSPDRVLNKLKGFQELTINKKIEMAENYGGYVGKYEICDKTIIHYPEVCGFTSFINTPLIRNFILCEDSLVLTCPYVESIDFAISELIWIRIM